jgi:hypothetical protein
MRENIVDKVMEIKFSISKYSQVFHGVSPGYIIIIIIIIIQPPTTKTVVQ